MPLLYHARTTPDDAVAQWAAKGREVEARREAARLVREADERRITETKLQAIQASRDEATHAYLKDMLPAIVGPIAERIEERAAEATRDTQAAVDRFKADVLHKMPTPADITSTDVTRRMQ